MRKAHTSMHFKIGDLAALTKKRKWELMRVVIGEMRNTCSADAMALLSDKEFRSGFGRKVAAGRAKRGHGE